MAHTGQRGFTLVELLIAISVLAVMAVLGWRGVDAMVRAQDVARGHADQVAIVQTALAQWQSDLDHAQESGVVNVMEHDGRVFRLTRKGRADSAAEAGLRVVGWTRRDGPDAARWLRWQSESLTTRAQLLAAWDQAARWARGDEPAPPDGEVSLAAIEDLQVLFFRGDEWIVPSPAAGRVQPRAAAAAPQPGAAPDGVRLVVTLAPGHALSGTITQDWVRPSLGGGKS